jgi:hypothetical protein
MLFLMPHNVYGMVSCGITKQFPISLHRPFLRATNLRKPLKPACTIPCVVRWPLLFSNLFVSFLTHCLSVRALERDGLEGSFGIFGLRASLAGMPNVPESEGIVCVCFMLLYFFLFSSFLNVVF